MQTCFTPFHTSTATGAPSKRMSLAFQVCVILPTSTPPTTDIALKAPDSSKFWNITGLPFLASACFPGGSASKESTCNAGDLVSIPGLGRSPGEGKGYPLQYSGLENSMDCIAQGLQRVGHD